MTASTRTIVAGFIPLTDCAILAAAREKGFASAENIDLVLVRETSWANIRDRVSVGHFDVAHMLAPMAIAANLGLGPLPARMIAPMALGFGGNTITVSKALAAAMQEHGGSAGSAPAASALALRKALAGNSADVPPVFAIVHPHSSHHYELAWWLRSAGLLAGRDVELTVLPPTLMADALASGQIAGFCAGEPWGTVAAVREAGEIVTTSPALWRACPGKVLGMRETWAASHPDELAALLRCLWRAAEWCDEASNREELAAILSSEKYLAQPREILAAALCPPAENSAPAMFSFFRDTAVFPWQSHALWYFAQMVIAGQCSHSADNAALARASYRPDLFCKAIEPLGAGLPIAHIKIEGARHSAGTLLSTQGQITLGPDAFFDGRPFDPAALENYIAEQLALVA